MLIKRFEGPTLKDVVRQVRAELGPDAIVLSQRERDDGSWFSRGKGRVVEVTAAIDRARLQPPPEAAGRTRADASWEPLQLTRALIEPLEDEIRALRRTVEAAQRPQHDGELAEQIRELRRLAQELERARRPDAVASPASDAAAAFLRAGLRLDLAEGLAAEVGRRLEEGESESRARVDALAERLDEVIATPRPDLAKSQMVIGAPGVGKTTTLAKLVDRQPGRDLTILSADTDRQGASARLRGAASALGIPFEVLDSSRHLSRLRRGTLFVDTPGFTGRPATGLLELRQQLGARAEIQLVVAATTKEADLRAQLRASEGCTPSSLIVTRTDETQSLANVVNLVLEAGAPPLAWLGCGELIPDDLEQPDARQLACRVLGVSA